MHKVCFITGLFATSTLAAPELNATKADPHVVVDSPSSSDSRTPKFKGLDVAFLDTTFSDNTIKTYREKIEKLNANKNPENIWKNLTWDVQYYNQENLPVLMGEIVDKMAFSKQWKGKGLRFLDLPIYMPDQGWQIPVELEQFKEVIQKIVEHERILNPTFEKNHYVYITVDQGIVPPNQSQRRSGWHGDSYRKINTKNKAITVPVDHLYVIYDNCPTVFLKGPFPIDDIDSENIDAVLEKFAKMAKNQKPIYYPNYTIARMDPYCVHDAGINTTDKPLHRTFVKISVSRVKYAHLGNATNNLFKYDWPMVPRHGVPYTKDAISQSSHRKDRDEFLEINPADIDFLTKKSQVKWADSQIKTVYKTRPIKAEPAHEGDILETCNDDFLITVNVAQKGDCKVTFFQGNQGFMSKEEMMAIYDPIPHQKDWYQPKKILRRAVQLTKDVRYKSPWGALSYAKAGDYLVYINENDIYTVPKKDFEGGFEILD